MSAPSLLGPYRIGEVIGRGGMGNVYAAEHQTTGHQVAVKLISAHVADEPRFRRRFEKEIHALKLLKHPGIVRLIGYGEENGQLFYSMELVQGETLQTRIRREKRLSWQETIDIAIQICAALKHAHDIGIQHRDLKPANLMLTRDHQVKLVDFGIPKNFWDSSEETVAGSVLGTPDYMAPEQADGGQITGRTDLYSLGSVMYAMLAGRSPFKGKSATAVIESLKRERPIPLSMIVSDAPDELCELVHHLLEKVPGDRPPTALVVMNRLKAMQAGLQSKATALNDGPETRLSANGSDDSDSDGFGLSNADEISSGTVAKHSHHDSGTADRPIDRDIKTIVSVQDKTRAAGLDGDAKLIAKPGRVSEDPTQLSQSLASDEDQDSTTTTRFETVDHSQTTAGLLRPGEAAAEHSSKPALIGAIVAIVALLAIVGWAILQAMTPPSADQLYRAAVEQEDIDAAEAFLNRYADDDRVVEVNDIRMKHRLRTTLNRLKATQTIGIKELAAAEQSFLVAMQDRDTDPEQAREKLMQWLAAFGDASEGNPAHPLVELAQYDLVRLSSDNIQSSIDGRAMELMGEIQVAIELEDPLATEKKLRAIVATFADDPWAAPAIEQASRWLERHAEAAEAE
jgi:serine/threonine-protein kinase